MFSLNNTIKSSPLLRQLITATMQQSKRNPRGRHPYKGKKPLSTNAAAAPAFQNAAQSPPFPRVPTPPLLTPVPNDTPRFADLAKENLLHPILLKTITQDLKFDHMMPVQAATLRDLLADRIDCFGQAKTGTGKTMAFLLPAIQTMINKNRRSGSGVSLLVISPTRELAMQIAKEANALLQHLPQYKVSFAIGGTNKDSEEKKILGGCDILIATPGRLYDHLSSERVRAKFSTLNTLVLDEADRLLDMGFIDALKQIIRCLPDKVESQRQGMLFSATTGPQIEKFAHIALSPGYKFISTIQAGELNTHERVPQALVVVPTFSDVTAALVGSIRSEAALEGIDTFKAIVFAPTAALSNFYAKVLEQLPGMPTISVLHSRVSQSKRTKVTEDFRKATSGVLVATDVVARGMDFPLVTNVFQVGVPSDKESYIHRLGRTARAGAEGRGTFIVTEYEKFFPTYNLKAVEFNDTPADLSSKNEVIRIAERLDDNAKTYQAWLGYYKNHMKAMGWNNARLVQEGNTLALEGFGCPEVPEIYKSTVSKMGLKGTPGLNIVPEPPRTHHNRGGGGEGRSKGSGGQGKKLNAGREAY